MSFTMVCVLLAVVTANHDIARMQIICLDFVSILCRISTETASVPYEDY